MYTIADWDTEEEYKTFPTETEALMWIAENCTNKEGQKWKIGESAYYKGNRIELY